VRSRSSGKAAECTYISAPGETTRPGCCRLLLPDYEHPMRSDSRGLLARLAQGSVARIVTAGPMRWPMPWPMSALPWMTLACQEPFLTCAALPRQLGLSGFLSPRNRQVGGSNPPRAPGQSYFSSFYRKLSG
jgi:hypothetical protein